MALQMQKNPAFGWPGALPHWARADKSGVGTARSLSSEVWFTAAGGVITEVYYPDVDSPQILDLQLLVTDGATFFHDGKRDFNSVCQPIASDALGLHLVNTAIGQSYVVIQDVIAEPGSSCLLVRTQLQGARGFLTGLHVYVLLAPHLNGYGSGNTWLALDADGGFRMTGLGYVGVNDGWQDIIAHRRLPIWNFDSATNGNIALTAEIDLSGQTEFVFALAFGQGAAPQLLAGVSGYDPGPNGALVTLSEALSYPFEAAAGEYSHLSLFLSGWKDVNKNRFQPKPQATFDQGRLFNISRNVLLSHEDKIYNGALVASLGIPWGESAGDRAGGYHLVWPRDMCQSATALLASGEVDLALRGLMYLAASQAPDGSVFQNFYINGAPFGHCEQLDEFAFPIILAYRVSLAGALQRFGPRPMVLAAAGALIANGPMTRQERWEENEGYSPSTLASNIAGLVCAAHFASQKQQDQITAQFLLDHADFLETHIEPWTVTTQGTLLPQVQRHYIRLLPTHVKSGARDPIQVEDPNTAFIDIANGGGLHPAKDVVDAGFLELVRYGVRPATRSID